jgi:hypothetical protein
MDEPIRVRGPSEPPSTDAAEAFAGYLDELERLCEAATPGPWAIDENRDGLRAANGNPIAETWNGTRRLDDARFIEAARYALPKLIAFVRTADLDGAASLDAFDAIAAMLGCSEWEYPGQLVRDVQALKERAETAEALVLLRDVDVGTQKLRAQKAEAELAKVSGSAWVGEED